jgi:acetyl esterase/lipase
VSPKLEIESDVVYAEVDGRPLCLDLHRPVIDGPVPVVVYFHGGGWMVGDRRDRVRERLVPVARQGIAVATVSYRFSDVATYPAQIHDAKAAVRWLRANGAARGLRTNAIGAWGASAGGYLALMLALTAGDPELEGRVGDHPQQRSDVQAACAFFPPTDFLAMSRHVRDPDVPLPPFIVGPLPTPSMDARMLGLDRVADDPRRAAAAAPLGRVHPGAPPVLLMHGDRDGLVPDSESRILHAALGAAGADARLLLLAGANHEGPEFDRPEALGAVLAFFRSSL